MVELRRRPPRRHMAALALRGEIAQPVIRVRRLIKIPQMAARAIRRRPSELPAHVATRAGRRDVFSHQRKPRLAIVIEHRALPRRRVVAQLALLRKARLHVIRLFGRREVRQMATDAFRRRPRKSPIHVALRTSYRRMTPRQRKLRHHVMVELGTLKRVEPMTVLTPRRQSRRPMIQRPRIQVILLMARDTLRAQSPEHPRRRAPMARIAGHCRVSPKQRKPVRVRLHLFHRRPPPEHRVAALAILAKLTAMQIRVTVGALVSNVRENLGDMARRTRDVLVQATQRILGLRIVVKLGYRTGRFPARCGMAIRARDRERTVWVPGFGNLCCTNQTYG